MSNFNTPFYPYTTTNAAGSFSTQSEGLVQGTFYDDPAVRYALALGTISSSATQPFWGGMAISEFIPPAGAGTGSLGGTLNTAASNAAITGFTVFNQAYSLVSSPQSQVPTAGAQGMTMPFFRLGSGARIAVAMDPSLVSLDGSLITSQVGWDLNNQVLAPFESTATYAFTSATPTYNNNGTWTIAVVMAVASPVGAVGDSINISTVTGTGASYINGNQVVSSFTNNQNFSFVVTAPASSISGLGSGQLNYGTGALACKVLYTNVGNSMTVSYNPTTGAANWNRTGSAAIIQI